MTSRDELVPPLCGIVPAHPGFFVLELLGGERSADVSVLRHPIVLWAVDRECGAIYPGTPERLWLDGPVLFPDGRVELANMCSYVSEAEWFAEQRQQLTRRIST